MSDFVLRHRGTTYVFPELTRHSTEPTPYRIMVSAIRFKKGRRVKAFRIGRTTLHGEYTELVQMPIGYMGWTSEQHYQEARLPGAGSFLYPGILAARRAAMVYLDSPNVTQVSIRTNQDKTVYRYVKGTDGRVTGYGGE